MAFHVDYWNDLGWPDRFAAPAFSQRQRTYRKSGLVNTVYTPGFVLDGEEWRGWFNGVSPDIRNNREVGRLSLEVWPGERVEASFTPAVQAFSGELTAQLAVLGFRLSSHIGRGENAGRILDEDFVVLGVSSTVSDNGGWTLPWPETRPAEPQRQAVVVWLSRQHNPAPLQAAGGWLP